MRWACAVCLWLASTSALAQETPPVMLWVWHGPHDLRGMPASIGVAYLARTMRVHADGSVDTELRHSPLRLDDTTVRWGVMRIELDRGVRPEAFERAIDPLVRGAAIVAREPGVRALQIDFDAPLSLHAGYATLLARARAALAPGQRLSITALGSWCVSDRWLDAVDIDVVVPMLFGPGHDVELVDAVLQSERVLPEPRCREALGVREGSNVHAPAPTIFVFPERGPWTVERANAYAP